MANNTELENELQAFLRRRDEVWHCVPPLVCKSGLRMSVQASRTHMCTPMNDEGPWRSVEVGFPSRRVNALLAYRDKTKDRTGRMSPATQTVYCYVPLSVVAEVVRKNGGLA